MTGLHMSGPRIWMDETGSRGWINNRFKEGEGREQPITGSIGANLFFQQVSQAERKVWMK